MINSPAPLRFQIRELPQTESTFTYLRTLCEQEPDLPSGTVITSQYQTRGRGQAGNSWFSTSGLNLLPSLFLRHFSLPVAQVWSLSEMVALAVADTVAHFYRGGSEVQIKWPNDILLGGKKISGILIATDFSADGTAVERMIAGIGVNVNEANFPPELPQATSLLIETGQTHPLMPVLHRLLGYIGHYAGLLFASDGAETLHRLYLKRLFGRGSEGRYVHVATGEPFTAAIREVTPGGELVLCTTQGQERRYRFKEVQYLY